MTDSKQNIDKDKVIQREIVSAFDQVKASPHLKACGADAANRARQHKRGLGVKKSMLGALAAACAACILWISLGSSGNMESSSTVISYVSIDINPSIELSLDEDNQVVEAEAYNEDGRILLESLNVKGESYLEAIETIVRSQALRPYLVSGAAISFTVASEDAEREQILLSEIADCAEGFADEAEQFNAVETCAVSVEMVEEAHGCGMSLGKYAAYRHLAEYDDTVTAEDCHDMTMEEIRQRITDHEERHHTGHSHGHH